MLECGDGTTCDMDLDGWNCCASAGGRARCPPDFPHMCAKENPTPPFPPILPPAGSGVPAEALAEIQATIDAMKGCATPVGEDQGGINYCCMATAAQCDGTHDGLRDLSHLPTDQPAHKERLYIAEIPDRK